MYIVKLNFFTRESNTLFKYFYNDQQFNTPDVSHKIQPNHLMYRLPND